jgi:hypothetical protein
MHRCSCHYTMRDRRLKRGESMTMSTGRMAHLGNLTRREFTEQAAKTGLQEESNFQVSAV